MHWGNRSSAEAATLHPPADSPHEKTGSRQVKTKIAEIVETRCVFMLLTLLPLLLHINRFFKLSKTK